MTGSREDRQLPRHAWLRRSAGRLHRCQRGQAIYVVVVFFFLLAGLLFLILNSGEKLNHKIETQGAADSVAATGADWYARGLNVISFCNTTETQLLSMIVLLDTLETVTPPSKEVIDEFISKIGQSKAGRDMPNDPRLQGWLVVGEAREEQKLIHQFQEIVSAINWPEYLTYDSGILWQCAKLMDGFSRAMAKDTPRATTREALDVATKNHADFGFIAPLWPELPLDYNRQFQDFEEPMRTARLPAPNTGQLIGGFAWVLNYRGYRNQVMGPWGYWREPLTDPPIAGLLDISRFATLFKIVSEQKLQMMFNSGADDRVALTTQWEMDYDKARGLDPKTIVRTWWEDQSYDGRYESNEETKPFPPPPAGAWDALKNPPAPTASRRSYSGASWPSLTGWTRATQSYEGADARQDTWFRVVRRRSPNYPELHIYAPHPPTHPDGSQWPYTDAEMRTYWQVRIKKFLGAEIGQDTTLHRMYVGPGDAPLAPILFTSEGDNLVPNIETYFTFSGYAYRSGKVRNWADRFVNPNPIEDLVCYAQARVYNRWGWDLFTQHWKPKLVRAGPYGSLTDSPDWGTWHDNMLSQLDQPVPDNASEAAAALTSDKIEPVRKMLRSYSPNFIKEVTH